MAGLKLRTLELPFALTDLSLKHSLAAIESPTTLSLSNSEVTDAGLKELAGLKSLQTLDLSGTEVTDAGLKELAGLKSLQTLDLSDTKVTGAGLKELAGLKNLQSLNLDYTQVTDAGLKELAGLKSLQSLHLGYTKVTDAGLKELAGPKNLQTLDLNNTKVTNAGLKELRMALPGCRIGPDVNNLLMLKLLKPLMSPAELPLPLLKKLAASKVPRPEAASRIALEHKFKAAGILAEEGPVVAGLLIDNENDLIWVVRFTRIDRDPRFSQATDYEVRVSSTTGVAHAQYQRRQDKMMAEEDKETPVMARSPDRATTVASGSASVSPQSQSSLYWTLNRIAAAFLCASLRSETHFPSLRLGKFSLPRENHVTKCPSRGDVRERASVPRASHDGNQSTWVISPASAAV